MKAPGVFVWVREGVGACERVCVCVCVCVFVTSTKLWMNTVQSEGSSQR